MGLEQVGKSNVAVQAKIIPGIPTGLAHNNIDRQEEALSGAVY